MSLLHVTRACTRGGDQGSASPHQEWHAGNWGRPRSIQSRSALRFREAGNRRGVLVTTLGHEQRRSKHGGRKPHAPICDPH